MSKFSRKFNKFRRIAYHPKTQYFVSSAGIYFIFLKAFGDQPLVKDNPNLFGWATGFVIFALWLIALLRYKSEQAASTEIGGLMKVYEHVLRSTNLFVGEKVKDFKEATKNLNKSKDFFEQVTNPEPRINRIVLGIESTLELICGIHERKLAVTVLAEDPRNNKWYRLESSKKTWNMTQPAKLMSSQSSAARAVATGEVIFEPCKIIAAREKRYFPSKRDKDHKNKGRGSIFAYPYKLDFKDGIAFKFVICIASYGVSMVEDPRDTGECEALETILSAFSSRIELEICLLSMKKWKNLKA